MNVIVPLAGPDFVHPTHGVRPLFDVNGQPLILAALESRPWIQAGEVSGRDLIFVFRDLPEVSEVRPVLERRFPGHRSVVLSQGTGGALLSALAGSALVADERPLCIDLVDILFNWPDWPGKALWRTGLGGVAPSFTSDDPAYSYFEMDGDRVVRAAEKVVISDRASAGAYLFRDLGVFLSAAGHSSANRATLSYRDTLFVCPAMNGVLAQGLDVAAPRISGVRSVSKLFK